MQAADGQTSGRSPFGPPVARGMGRWLKPAISLAAYALVFSLADTSAILASLRGTRLGFVGAGILLYAAGQVVSAWRWQLLLAPVELRVPFLRLVGFYFTGMFFNLFLPTVVGGDAVKAILLSRETGAPARATVSVFMERNVGLLALLTIATIASWITPPVELGGLPLSVLTSALAAAYVIVNVVLLSPAAHRAADRLMRRTPLAPLAPRMETIYSALAPYRRPSAALGLAIVLGFVFQLVVIGVVFLNALALTLDVPLSAVAVFVPLVSLAGMIPVSVNGLGVREALYILLFGRLGVSAEASVSLALLYLGVTMAASLPGGIAYALQKTPARLATRQAASDPR